jgi:hypothetical protein
MKYFQSIEFRLFSLKSRSKYGQLFLNSNRKTFYYSFVIDLKNDLYIANVLLFLSVSLFLIFYNIFLNFITNSYYCFFVLKDKKIAIEVFEYFNSNSFLLGISQI